MVELCILVRIWSASHMAAVKFDSHVGLQHSLIVHPSVPQVLSGKYEVNAGHVPLKLLHTGRQHSVA